MARRKRKSKPIKFVKKRGGAIKKKKRRNSRRTRKGKINPWLKGAIAAVAPSVVASGYGLAKHLLRNKYAGYTNIYS